MTARLADAKAVGARGVMNPERAAKVAAKRIGCSVDEYRERRANGEKWCPGCLTWHVVSAFTVDRYRSDGYSSRCRESKRSYNRSYFYQATCERCGGPRHVQGGRFCRTCYSERSVENAWIREATKQQRRIIWERGAAKRRALSAARVAIQRPISLDALVGGLDHDRHGLVGADQLAVPVDEDPLAHIMRDRLWHIVGDTDVTHLDEHELSRLRERLLSEGISTPAVQSSERERLRDPERHSGERVKTGGGHGGKRSRDAQSEVTRAHHVRNMTKAQKREHARRRRAATSQEPPA